MNETSLKKGKVAGLLFLSFFLFLLSFAPYGYPAVFFCLIPLLIVIQSISSLKSAFLTGLSFGFLFFAWILFWIVNVSWVGFLLFLIYNSLFMALFFAGAYYGKALQKDLMGLFFLPALWVLFEWGRSLGFLALPVGFLGYQLMPSLALSQGAALFGVYGLSFFIVMINSLFWSILQKQAAKRFRCLNLFFIFILLGSLFLAGHFRLRQNSFQDGIQVALIQSNTQPVEKWNELFLRKIILRHNQLTYEAVQKGSVDFVIWPETAVPTFLLHPKRKAMLERIQAVVSNYDVPLLTGAQKFRPQGEEKQAYNVAVFFSEDGHLSENYAKAKLFPFMEQSPFKFLTPYLRKLGMVSVYSPGLGAKRIVSDHFSFSPLICYETFFPSLVRKAAKTDPDFIVNITNDAVALGNMAFYYRVTANITRMRAIETGLSLVRAANNGYSFAVDPLGRVLYESPLFNYAAETVTVPMSAKKTFYTLGGHDFPYLCLFLVFLGILIRLKSYLRIS